MIEEVGAHREPVKFVCGADGCDRVMDERMAMRGPDGTLWILWRSCDRCIERAGSEHKAARELAIRELADRAGMDPDVIRRLFH
jgi:hypothetical protein